MIEMLSQMLLESRKYTVRSLTDYESSYRSHENVYVEIEKKNPEGAAKMMMEHFALIETRATQRNVLSNTAQESK
jgi:DNA-binding GntR family transcriptional regulator